MIVEQRQCEVQAPLNRVYKTFIQLGGDRGWLYFDWAWKARGALDRMIGGVGMRQGRRDQKNLRVGDTLDFWRVEAVEANKLLRLRAEMILPGQGFLQFEVYPLEYGQSKLIQTAYFEPKGLFGRLYWYGLYPIHALIFSGLIRKLKQAAES